MMINLSELRSLKKSFLFAIRGLIYCIKNERNMRIHIVVAANVILFSIFFDLTRIEYALLFLIIGLVLLCETINTAIEALVNLGAPSYHSLARIAKDVAAGAVLLVSVISVAVAIVLFGHPNKLFDTLIKIVNNPMLFSLFLLLIGGGIVFIFKGFKLNLTKKMKKTEEVKIYKPKKKSNFKF